MTVLAMDIGSSSVKAAVVRDGRIAGRAVNVSFATRFAADRAEVEPAAVMQAIAGAVRELGDGVRGASHVAIGHMAPSWVAMDAQGRPLTPIITHQDRRSVEQARRIEATVGKERHLAIAGVRPIPGGISSTTFAWFAQHAADLVAKFDLVGHLGTFLHRQWTGARATDPSNATFMGLFCTCGQSGWSDELCEAAGCPRAILPEIRPANAIAGRLNRAGAEILGLPEETPVLTGMVDTGSAFLLEEDGRPRVGRMVNVSGSTDVLALCADRFAPHERLLTRALGVDGRWLAVSTIAAAGSSLRWAKEQLFPDLSQEQFYGLLAEINKDPAPGDVRFEPYLAGDRMSIDQPRAEFSGLTLSTTRRDMLAAVVDALAKASAARIDLLRGLKFPILPEVVTSGGLQKGLGEVLYRDWPGQWSFRTEDEATVRGLGRLAPR